MTLQSSDFTATHNFLVNCDYKAERNETCKSRAHILCALESTCAAAAQSGGDPDALEPALARKPPRSTPFSANLRESPR